MKSLHTSEKGSDDLPRVTLAVVLGISCKGAGRSVRRLFMLVAWISMVAVHVMRSSWWLDMF